VTLVGRKLKTSRDILVRPYKTHRFNLWFHKSVLFYANYIIRLFFFLLGSNYDVIVSNDLDTLPACWLAGKIRRKILIFDSHELFTEVPELVNKPLIRKAWLILEKLLLPHVKFGYTVSPPIQEYYKLKYNNNFELVRNVGHYREDTIFKGFSDEIVILYQGAVNLGRGLELMLATLNHLNNIKLWIVGEGDIFDDLKEISLKLGVEKKVVFFGRKSIDNLLNITSQAHIGISLEEDLGLNYRYALPNKLFDYIQSRVPVIVSDLPEMRNLVEKYKIGLVLQKRTPESLAQIINQLISGNTFQSSLSQNLETAARELSWQREEEKLIGLYRKACAKLLAQVAL
jgi:glycosyltransferase involved in cell wall biosynthesis